MPEVWAIDPGCAQHLTLHQHAMCRRDSFPRTVGVPLGPISTSEIMKCNDNHDHGGGK